MEIGRWYQRQHLYTAAIGRFQRVVDNYQTTNHVPEALSRLTEIYLQLGMRDEARRTASVLGYNYPGNSWYQNSYNAAVRRRAGAERAQRAAHDDRWAGEYLSARLALGLLTRVGTARVGRLSEPPAGAAC